MKEDYIVVEHAVKKYKDTIALNDVSLTFAQNQIHGIIGRRLIEKVDSEKETNKFIYKTGTVN